jgi:hypothetical protein
VELFWAGLFCVEQPAAIMDSSKHAAISVKDFRILHPPFLCAVKRYADRIRKETSQFTTSRGNRNKENKRMPEIFLDRKFSRE